MRNDNIKMLQNTLQIMNIGYYSTGNRQVDLKLSKEQMETVQVLLPEHVRDICSRTDFAREKSSVACEYDCPRTDSYSAAITLSRNKDSVRDAEKPVLVLNFANPVNPGGGVRRGARAQEEDLCRNSSLLLSLESAKAAAYYRYNRSLSTYMGSDAMIFTPEVEIIKDASGKLLDETVIVSVLTCAAPMISHGLEGMTEESYQRMVYNRIIAMLKCTAYFGYTVLVLGAWGCGAFGNDAAVFSDLFYKALKELDYNGMHDNDLFRHIDFAVRGKDYSSYNYNEFYRNFGGNHFYRQT